jgi:hypothetical protein
MIKKLFFTAALLVPGLAHGADPSANLPIQIVPASAVPAPAQAAGFTTLALNEGPNLGNPNTWLDCAGASPPKWWFNMTGFSSNMPCSAVSITNDPADGLPSIKIHWEDSYANFGGRDVTSINSGPPGEPPPNAGRFVSPGFYTEAVLRTDWLSNDTVTMDYWSLPAASAGAGYELDFMEETGAASSYGAAMHNHYGCNTPGCSGGSEVNTGAYPFQCPTSAVGGCNFDFSIYHKYAARQTSAGTDRFFCAYIDDQLQGCTSIYPNDRQLVGVPQVIQLQMGRNQGKCCLSNGSTGANTWVRSIKVWQCAQLSTSNSSVPQCNSSSNNP